jgi:glycosyltransferase involved in cell wall biosynthesis
LEGSQLHICHISVLNPAVHTRIFFKMAISQAKAGHQVRIIAQDDAQEPYDKDGVQIIPMGRFGRLSFKRWKAAKVIAAKVLEIKPDILQVHAIELIPMALELKKSLPALKVIWDMHEDYAANIRAASYYPSWMKPRILKRIQAAIQAFEQSGDGLILAEQCFEGLLKFPAERRAVAQNKYQVPEMELPVVHLPIGLPLMALTGTIAETWGSLRALELWQQLNQHRPVGLVIAGHSHDKGLIRRIEKMVEASGLEKRFFMAGGKDYLPYDQVLACIRRADLGLALYHPQPHIRERIPTKFFEFMGNGKPLVFSQNPTWDALNEQLHFGKSIPWPASEDDLKAILAILERPQVLQIPPSAWNWEQEAKGMLALLEKVSELPKRG